LSGDDMMAFFDFFRRKKDDSKDSTKDSARDSAKERLEMLVGNGRRFVYKIDDFTDKEDLAKKTEEIKEKIRQEASELFNTEADKVKIVVEEHNGYVIIITNINFD